MEKRELSYNGGQNGNWYSHCGELWRFLKETKNRVTIYPAIPLLGIVNKLMGIYPEKRKAPIQKDTCAPMLISALLTITKT